jgi:hypothetical protein
MPKVGIWIQQCPEVLCSSWIFKILESFRNKASYAPGAGRLSISSDTSAAIALDIPTVVKFHAVKLPARQH